MSDTNEVKVDEVKVERCWGNGLKRLDGLMSYMYDREILGKVDRYYKDTKFYRYYRYYNDGDFPRGLKGIRKYASSDTEVAEALERDVTDFMKRVLKKYKGKINRKDFRNSEFYPTRGE